ncbi:MAG: L-lactate permease [Brevinema sp.]
MILSLIALIPILVLVIGLMGLKKPSIIIAPMTLIITILLAFFVWHQPVSYIGLAGLEGVLYGLWPIGIIIFGSICLSNLMVASGAVKNIEKLIASVSTDQRISVVLVAWSLSSFLEAIAGLGSGLALPISILMIMGVSPFKAGLVALLANSVPTAYGGVGIGIDTIIRITGLPIADVTKFIGYQLLIPSLVMPFIITFVIAGSFKKVREVWLVPFFAGLGQAIGLIIPLNNPGMTAIASGVLNIAAGLFAASVFYPQFRASFSLDRKTALKAISAFLIAVGLIIITGPLVAPINDILNNFYTKLTIYPSEKAKALYFNWFTDAGVLLFIAGILGAKINDMSVSNILKTIGNTVLQLRKTLVVLLSILAMSKIMTYSGIIDSLSTGLANAVGIFYPILSPLLGTIGVFVTGSVVSSSVLMGSLQAEMGMLLGVQPAWLVAMNISGATAGKMLAPHSVAIVMAAIGTNKEESRITGILFKVLISYAVVMMFLSAIGSILLK